MDKLEGTVKKNPQGKKTSPFSRRLKCKQKTLSKNPTIHK